MTAPFRPAWWLPGPHAQTLGARLLRTRRSASLTRERVELADGDFVDLDWSRPNAPRARAEGGPLVLVLHGLEGSARSRYALQMYRALELRGMEAVGLNFRSCSGEINRLARLYHSGETGDLTVVLQLLRRRFPGRALGAVGFSLGGNVLLKYLGEAAGAGFPDILAAAVAISIPFDLAAGARRLEQGFARLYRWYLLRRLKRKVRRKASVLAPLMDVARALRARTFPEFDDRATAPLHGFASADDYYRRSSCAQFLTRVRVPTLLIHASDDPFLPPDAIPRDVLAGHSCITTAFTERGGHVGFVSGPPWSPSFWAEATAAEFLGPALG